MNSLVEKKDEKVFQNFAGEIPDEEIEKAETVFLSHLERLCLLYETPFHYLVPEPGMLPQESLRFFEVDARWIYSLLDGACSIGRNTPYDVSHDELLIQTAYRCALKHAGKIRMDLAAHRNAGKDIPPVEEGYTGFLLHSRLVSDYNGLEVRAFGRQQEQLFTLRLEKLSDMVMFGLFAGRIFRMTIAQPREALHFGSTGLPLRRVNDGAVLLKGQDKLYDLPMKKDRVIDLQAAVEEIRKKPGIRESEFTSAQLALELIQNAYTVAYERGEEEIRVADR